MLKQRLPLFFESLDGKNGLNLGVAGVCIGYNMHINRAAKILYTNSLGRMYNGSGTLDVLCALQRKEGKDTDEN